MTSKLFSKKQVQRVIRDMRKDGYNVTKDKFGKYDCELDGTKIFTAIPGRNAYLVRYDAKLLTEAN